MIIEWFLGIILSCSLEGFCNSREIFVSPSGRDNMNCTTMDNPCLTIQYAIDNVAISNDVMKIDGSLGNFILPRAVRISNCKNVTFSSYNGVAWVYRPSSLFGKASFLVTVPLREVVKCELHFDTINFLDTTIVRPDVFYSVHFIVNLTVTVKNCQFNVSRLWPSPYKSLIRVANQHSFIAIENCTIKLSNQIGILLYDTNPERKEFFSTQIILRSTQIEDAMYTVYGKLKEFRQALLEKRSRLYVINSVLRSTRKHGVMRGPQFSFSGRMKRYFAGLFTIYMESSRFENFLVVSTTAAVLDIRWPSRVLIDNCTFKDNIGIRGGALFVQSSNLVIVGSQFYDNKAATTKICELTHQEGKGGAMFLDSELLPMTVKIYKSSFINNRASCIGSAVYLAEISQIIVQHTQFISHFTRSSDTIWFSHSMSLQVSHVSFEAREGSKLPGELFIARAESFYERISDFKCPVGSTLHFSDSDYSIFKVKKVTCQYCPNGTYKLSPSNLFGLNGTGNKLPGLQPECHLCKFGAVCQHGVIPKPNFWGYVHESKAFIIVCPPGYCCQTSNQCNSLDSCNSKKTGRLCGKCKHGYFQSVFTTDCLEEKVCKTGKFWALAIITSLLFTVMFIFLQDIFSCIVKMLNMDKFSSVFQKRVHWFSTKLLLKRNDSYQREPKSEDETHRDSEGEELERSDELKMGERQSLPKNNSTATGLIKIIFFFYQIHSILTIYKSNREIQYLRDLKALVLSIFNLNAQIPLGSEFHCALHGMGSITKVWTKALFPVICLLFAGSIYACASALSYLFSRSDFIQKFAAKAKPRLHTAMLQLILLGYSTVNASILSLVTCISLVNGDTILYIDGNVFCYQLWQYAILIFILLWAIPLIYALHKLPCHIRNGEVAIRGLYTALLLPLPFSIYTVMRGLRRPRCSRVNDCSSVQYVTPLIPYVGTQKSNATISQLTNVIAGPFRYKSTEEKQEKLSWEPILLLQRLLLSLCHTFILEPGMRSLALLLLILAFGSMNFLYQPFGSLALNVINCATFMLLYIAGIINVAKAYIYEYGIVPKGPFVQLLDIFDYLEVIMVMIFPAVAVASLVILIVAKLFAFVASIVGILIAKCKRYKSSDD